MSIAPHIPKEARYTIGVRIEHRFLNLLEITYAAYFIEKEKKLQKIGECILTLDTLKFLLHTAWELKLISHTQYADVGGNLEEAGKMFGGWRSSLQNPTKKNRAR